MDFSYNPFTKEARVKLSRSNLKTLLHKLDNKAQGRFDADNTLVRVTEDDWFLMITAEEDEDHYGSRERGIMDADTEKAINEPLVHGDLPDYSDKEWKKKTGNE